MLAHFGGLGREGKGEKGSICRDVAVVQCTPSLVYSLRSCVSPDDAFHVFVEKVAEELIEGVIGQTGAEDGPCPVLQSFPIFK